MGLALQPQRGQGTVLNRAREAAVTLNIRCRWTCPAYGEHQWCSPYAHTRRSLLRRLVARRCFHDLERRPLDPAELFMQEGNARIGCHREGPVEAIVRDEHAVLLQALQDR